MKILNFSSEKLDNQFNSMTSLSRGANAKFECLYIDQYVPHRRRNSRFQAYYSVSLALDTQEELVCPPLRDDSFVSTLFSPSFRTEVENKVKWLLTAAGHVHLCHL